MSDELWSAEKAAAFAGIDREAGLWALSSIQRLVAMLRDVAWGTEGLCVGMCGAFQPCDDDGLPLDDDSGHNPSCKLAALLKEFSDD